jgi:hypothetical protein
MTRHKICYVPRKILKITIYGYIFANPVAGVTHRIGSRGHTRLEGVGQLSCRLNHKPTSSKIKRWVWPRCAELLYFFLWVNSEKKKCLKGEREGCSHRVPSARFINPAPHTFDRWTINTSRHAHAPGEGQQSAVKSSNFRVGLVRRIVDLMSCLFRRLALGPGAIIPKQLSNRNACPLMWVALFPVFSD